MNLRTILLASALTAGCSGVVAQQWIPMSPEAKPYTRWWWLGSAVDKSNLTYNLTEYAKAGIGGVEITPIYGVKGNDANEIPYLSPQWMKMLAHVESVGDSLGVETNMATGTGWPFGGPAVPMEEAAAKAVFQQYEENGASGKTIDISCNDKKQEKVARLSCVMAYRLKETADGSYVYKEVRNVTSKVTRSKSADGKTEVNKLNMNVLPKGDWTVVALYCGRTMQKVKRAAPGGEGWVIDHFDRKAVEHYLQRFDTAFVNQGVKPPHTFFNDSYEVYGADWTPALLDEFAKRRGYRLEEHFPDFLRVEAQQNDESRRIVSDYRQTMGELLRENFTEQWTQWAHKHNAITRNQAHGSPANLIDLYAEVDIPECEGFGLSDFGIRGLRRDTAYTRKNFSDISMLKYASSGAHISGKRYTSSETFTWLTEHFRTSLSQCKPDIDLFFISGINHVFFHGSCYSPKEEAWPGWRFYASVDMSPNNSYWRDMPAFTKYIERCQSFLQWGEPDNDFLVYLPFYDMIYEQPDRIALFDIHSMEKRAPKFINTVQSIIRSGYDVDYISDKYLDQTRYTSTGHLTTTGGNAYAAIIVPDVSFMPLSTLKHLLALANEGATVVFVKSLPVSSPGFGKDAEQKEFSEIIGKLKVDGAYDFTKTVANKYGKGLIVSTDSYSEGLKWCRGRRETMRDAQGLSCIRRSNPDGYHYFISNLQERDVDEWVALGVKAHDAAFYNPMNGQISRAQVKEVAGTTMLRVQLRSGESVIVRTFTDASADKIMAESGEQGTLNAYKYRVKDEAKAMALDGKWNLSFVESAPQKIDRIFTLDGPKAWTELGDSLCNTTMATGLYTTTFNLDAETLKRYPSFVLELGDVRESAHIRVNGKEAGILFAVPFALDIAEFVKEGENKLEIEVTNLPANRIAQLDREGVEWRKFKEINVVDLNYKKNTYENWTIVPSGLNSEVRIVPARVE